MTTATVPMSIRLAPSVKQKLKEIAARQKRTAHALATEAITALIEQKEREHAFNQSCVASYDQYKETGLHVTHDDIAPWLESLFTDHELPPPACHA